MARFKTGTQIRDQHNRLLARVKNDTAAGSAERVSGLNRVYKATYNVERNALDAMRKSNPKAYDKMSESDKVNKYLEKRFTSKQRNASKARGNSGG